VLSVFGADGRSPAPFDLYERIVASLTFTRTEADFSWGAADPVTGNPAITLTPTQLCVIGEHGILTCPAGALRRVAGVAAELGYRVKAVDMTGRRSRPDALVPHWDRLADFPWRPRQKDVVEAIARAVYPARTGGYIKAIPGFGKSFCFAAIARLFSGARIIFAVPDCDNLHKTYGDLIKYIPSPGAVGCGQNLDGRVRVVSYGSLHKISQDDVDLVIVDEVDALADKAFDQMIRLSWNAPLIGLSATPTGRADGTNLRLDVYFGPLLMEVGWEEGRACGLVLPLDVYMHDVRCETNPIEGVTQMTARFRWGIWRNRERNAKIAEIARWYTDDVLTLIIVQSIEHAVILGKLLPEFKVVYSEGAKDRMSDLKSSGLALEDYPVMTAALRNQYRLDFASGASTKFIANRVWAVGVSFEQLQVLIRADAQNSERLNEQIPGRAVRTHQASGKTRGVMHDFLDQFDHRFRNKAKRRISEYEANGWVCRFPVAETTAPRRPRPAPPAGAEPTRAVRPKRRSS
jgi:superfamily II DNA or RNA helicase